MKWVRKLALGLFAIVTTISVGQSAWISTSDRIDNISGTIDKDTTKKIVCYNKQTGAQYTQLDTAMAEAVSGQTVYVKPGSTFDVINNVNVKKGTTLIVPYVNEQYDCTKEEWVALQSATNFSDVDKDCVTKNRQSLINFRNGSNLNIENGGSVYLGGEFTTKGIRGKYTEFNLGMESDINVRGNFYCYGYVKKQVDIIDSYPDSRKIFVSSTGLLQTPMFIYDLPGSNSSTLAFNNDRKICPINIFDFNALQAFVDIQYGAVFKAFARCSINAAGMTAEINEPIIVAKANNGPAGDSMFILNNGHVSFNFKAVDRNGTLYSTTKNTLEVSISSNMDIGSIKLNVSAATIDTATYFLPLSYKFNILIKSGFTLTTNKKIKFLPGSELNIEKGGTFNVGNEVIFYKKDSFDGIDGSATYPRNNPKKVDAFCNNNGQIIATSSSAKLAGKIFTSANDDTAKVDLTIGGFNNNNLIVVSEESVNVGNRVTLFAEGMFFDSAKNESVIGCFSSGKVTISDVSGRGAWTAEQIVRSVNVSIKVVKPYDNNLYTYDFAISSDGKADSYIFVSRYRLDRVFTIPEYMYFKLTSYDAAKTEITVPPNTAFTNGKYYKSSSNFQFQITANRGVKLTVNGTGSSGHGSFRVSVFRNTKASTKGETVLLDKGNTSFTLILPLNCYFRLSTDKGIGAIVPYKTQWIRISDNPTADATKDNVQDFTETHYEFPAFVKTWYKATNNIYIRRWGAGLNGDSSKDVDSNGYPLK